MVKFIECNELDSPLHFGSWKLLCCGSIQVTRLSNLRVNVKNEKLESGRETYDNYSCYSRQKKKK